MRKYYSKSGIYAYGLSAKQEKSISIFYFISSALIKKIKKEKKEKKAQEKRVFFALY
jgi:hypothetical protein